jgi:hypothetical protein
VSKADDALRAELVRLAQAKRESVTLPPGYHAVLVVTDPDGAWVGVSSTAPDDYTARILEAALSGEGFRRHG